MLGGRRFDVRKNLSNYKLRCCHQRWRHHEPGQLTLFPAYLHEVRSLSCWPWKLSVHSPLVFFPTYIYGSAPCEHNVYSTLYGTLLALGPWLVSGIGPIWKGYVIVDTSIMYKSITCSEHNSYWENISENLSAINSNPSKQSALNF